MRKFASAVVTAAVALALSGVAEAAKTPGEGAMLRNAKGQRVVSARATPVERGSVPCLSVAGSTGNGYWFEGDPANTVIQLNIGAGNALIGLAADVTVTANGPSWLSEAVVTFSSTNPDDEAQLWYTPGYEYDEPGSVEASTEGVVMLADVDLDPVVVGEDGILRIEFNEGYDDEPVNPDSNWGEATSPQTCQGIRLVCNNQSACDATVPVTLQQFSVD